MLPFPTSDQYRQICSRTSKSAWPETDERIFHGAPTFWGGKKTFASFHENQDGEGRIDVWIKSDVDTQEGLVEANPKLFFIPPYVGPSGWLGVRLDRHAAGRADNAADVWDILARLLEDGYRAVAPQRALARLDDD